jgi:glutamate racemase
MARFGHNIELFENPCRGLVTQIESGELSAPATKQLLYAILQPMLDVGVDTLVLGCTHYPFVTPLINEIVAEGWPETAVAIIDPAPAVARQTQYLLQQQEQLAPVSQQGNTQLLTTGDISQLSTLSRQLLDQELIVRQLRWHNNKLLIAK